VLQSLLISIAGFVIGSLILMLLGFIFAKIFTKSLVSCLISEETKQRLANWLQEVFKNGINEALQDEEIKKIVKEILEEINKRLK